ncbi:hypothetical protein AO379_0616 [Moraxella catarrhalis]|nr:hypothetical protein AO379_0616 [Moraxella catarrhalis]
MLSSTPDTLWLLLTWLILPSSSVVVCRSWDSLVKYAFIMVYALCCDFPNFEKTAP